jgi:two-component system, chemotaxis family, sensor kinase CheA
MDSGDLEQLQASFRHEADDLLTDLGGALLLLELDPRNPEVINRVFRAMHTLKGSGASAGFRRLANFVHHVEEVFNRIRNKQLEATPELIDATLKACDCCVMLLDLGSTDSDTPLLLETEVLAAIQPFLPLTDKATAAAHPGKTAVSGPARYKIGFRPNREIFFSGTDPASLLLELTDLGEMEIRCDASDLLAAEPFDPEQCYLRWEVHIETSQPEEKLREVFQFVEDDCGVSIERVEPSARAQLEIKAARFRGATQQAFTALGFALDQFQSGAENPGLATAHRAAQTLISACKAHGHAGATTAARQVLDAVKTQQGGTLDGGWLPKVKLLIEAAKLAVDSPAAAQAIASLQAAPAAATAEALAAPEAATAAAASSIRVDSAKLDSLMRLAGELLVARGALPAFAERVERFAGEESPQSMVVIKTVAKEMRDAGAKVSRLADDLQATVMSIRMMPVRQVFQRFPRLVRDIARNLDKNIELHVSGEETELDKTVIDSIGDPLTHIIRNAADHGIESKADRAQKGKSAVGRIELSAFTQGSNVVIEVKDDGKGLDAEKLKRRAVEKGVLTETAVAAMDQQAAFKIILAAGFSTIDKVTDLSGRGVGMDVVRASVEALHGAIHIESEIGKGTSFRIELPASLLVSKAIRVSVSGQEVVLPIDTIRNMVKIPKSVVRTVQGQQIAPVRGTVFPMLWLAHALSFDQQEERRAELAIAIIETAAGPYGLVVDHFLGEVEIVVKPLSGVLAKMPEYIGAAIMGNGKTVLVVNTEKLFSLQRTMAVPHNDSHNDFQVASPQ